MEKTSILLMFAETGIVLAGFSGVVLALRQPTSGSLLARDRARLQDLLITALGASMYALFPLLLFEAGMDEQFVMQVSATFLGMFLVVGSVFLLRGGSGRISRRSILFLLPSLMVLLLLGLVAFGKLPRSQFFAYFFGLFWLLFLACANFFQLVVGRVSEDDGNADDSEETADVVDAAPVKPERSYSPPSQQEQERDGSI